MPLVVGTDTYATEAELEAFAEARGITLSRDSSVLLTLAMDYMLPMRWKGDKTDPNQALDWPRTSPVAYNGAWPVDYPTWDSDTVPDAIKRGQMMLAIFADSYSLSPVSGGVKSKSVGDVSVTYGDGASSNPRPNAALAILAPYRAIIGASMVTRA